MSGPVETDIVAQIVGDFIEALMTGGEDVAEAYLTAQFPFLANPIMQSILDWLVKDFGQAIQTVVINGTTSMVISIQSDSERAQILAAATALQIAQNSGDQDAIKKALEGAKEAYGSVIHWDGIFNSP